MIEKNIICDACFTFLRATSARPWKPSRTLSVVPCSISDARAFVDQHHRHHSAPVGGLFAVGVARDGEVAGVAIVGRPVARQLQDGWTAEVTRCCTDGSRNACSMLYAAAWRGARALGWRRLVTYTLESESGASLRGAGWEVVAETRGGSWDTPSRPRVDRHPLQRKLRWAPAGSEIPNHPQRPESSSGFT